LIRLVTALLNEPLGWIEHVTPTPPPPATDPHASLALLVAGVFVAIAVVVAVYFIRRAGARRSQ
jgi:hypothetical protein